MPTYKITNPTDGKVIRLTGDAPPTELDIQAAFDAAGNNADVDIHTLTETYSNNIEDRPSVDDKIQERGTAFFSDRVNKLKEAKGFVGKTFAGINLANTLGTRTEAAIANGMMAIQNKGDFVEEFAKGAKGEKLGEFGDVLRKSGVPVINSEPFASTAGFVLSMAAPVAGVKKGLDVTNRLFRKISLKSDKQILDAGQKLINGTDDAVAIIGRNVDNAYKPIEGTYVDGLELIKSFDKTPTAVIRHIENELGTTIDTIAQKATIADVRKIKHILGKLRPTAFGKSEKGVAETIDDLNINKTYSDVKNVIHKRMKALGAEKESEMIMKADEAFSDASGAAAHIKREVMHPLLNKPTRGGKVAAGLVKEGDASTREALITLKKAGETASKNIDDALDALYSYNRHLAIKSALQTGVKAAVYGGAVGAIGGMAIGKIIPRN